jgi:uncharacterized cupin superfamily protein
MAPNVFDPDFEEPTDREGFTHRRARIGWDAGSERLGASLFEVEPGNACFPLHWHSNNEEMLIVLSGRPTLRTPAGERELNEGEVVAFPVGEEGAHQVINRGEGTVRFLIVSEMNAVDLNGYPDTGKIVAMNRAPGGRPREGSKFLSFRESDAVDYIEGEPTPADTAPE